MARAPGRGPPAAIEIGACSDESEGQSICWSQIQTRVHFGPAIETPVLNMYTSMPSPHTYTYLSTTAPDSITSRAASTPRSLDRRRLSLVMAAPVGQSMLVIVYV